MQNDEMNEPGNEKSIKRAFSGRIHKVGYSLWPAISARIAACEESPRALMETLASFAYTVALMLVGVFIGNFVSVYKTPAMPESDWTGLVQDNASHNRGEAGRSKNIWYKTE